MLSAPSLKDFPRYPVIAGTAVLAIGVTIAWWARVDISPLVANAEIRRGEVWRLLTSIFPHIDVLHLAFNVYWLWVFGALVEDVYGHAKTAALIVLFAVGSNAFDFALSHGGVGLSGVGYGLFGLLWILSKHDERFRGAVDERTVTLFIGWFVFCIVATIANVFNVANVAHGAGAILGILVGAAISIPQRRWVAAVGGMAFVALGLWGATLGRPRVNLAAKQGYEEGKWGYEALMTNRNKDAVRWLRDATVYQPQLPEYWFDLGIAYQRLGNRAAATAAYQKAHHLAPNDPAFSIDDSH